MNTQIGGEELSCFGKGRGGAGTVQMTVMVLLRCVNAAEVRAGLLAQCVLTVWTEQIWRF